MSRNNFNDVKNIMEEFKQYRKTKIAEMREVTKDDIYLYHRDGVLIVEVGKKETIVSIADEDLKNNSPKFGDMIARNPKNHSDQWLVAKEYFNDNFEPI